MTTFKNIYFQTTIRVIAMFIILLVIASIFGEEKFFFTQIILGIVVIVQLLELIDFYNKANKELASFLYSLKESDFTISFSPKGNSKSENELFQAFNEVTNTFKQLKTENEASYHFLKEIINGLDVGLIVLDAKQNIELINKTALSALNIPEIKSWKHLKGKNIELIDKIDEIEQFGTHLIEYVDAGEQKLLSLTYSELIILKKSYRFVLFKNIRSEIESKEIQAWHKLIRILTHEIMNSMTPLASLSGSLSAMLSGEFNEEIKQDLMEGLDTISERSKSLLHFVEDYRKLSRVPDLNIKKIAVSKLINLIPTLFKAEIKQANIELTVNTDSEISINADEDLIGQVLINLFKNSMQAVENATIKCISISSVKLHTQTVIKITDTGHGIPKDKLNKIFVPFFSTKEEGSGIGLSLSRQIINKHNGRIEVISTEEETTFSLYFNK